MLLGINLTSESITIIELASKILFSAIATILGVLTYIKARQTLFQPLRSEVIKRQSKLYADMLEFFKVFTPHKLYLEMVSINFISELENFGFILSDSKTYLNNKKLRRGALIVAEPGELLEDVKVISLKDEDIDHFKLNSKNKYEKLLQGEVNIQLLQFGDEYLQYKNELKKYLDNVFVPSNLNILIREYDKIIYENITGVLKDFLENFFCNNVEEIRTQKFNMNAIYNLFNRKVYSNRHVVDTLSKKIKKLLMIK